MVIASKVVVSSLRVAEDEISPETVVASVVVTESSAVVDRGSVVSGLLDTELSMVVDSIAVSVSVVETDDGRHGPALTLWMAKTANAPERKDDEIMFKSE